MLGKPGAASTAFAGGHHSRKPSIAYYAAAVAILYSV